MSDSPAPHRRESPESIATTRRAEEIRESTGCSWESACARAELERDLAPDAPHVGHFSRLGGTWWCDTCDSPYCDLA